MHVQIEKSRLGPLIIFNFRCGAFGQAFPFASLKRSSFGSSKVDDGTLVQSLNLGLHNLCQMVMVERMVVTSAMIRCGVFETQGTTKLLRFN